jgi:small ligand-binding sensory domain FIST
MAEPRFAAASATAADAAEWAAAAFACVERLGGAAQTARLGFVYVTDPLADRLGEIAAFLRRTTSVTDWVGTVGLGIVADREELFETPAISLLVAELPRGSWRLIGPQTGAAAPSAAAPSAAATRAAQLAAPGLAIAHADPRCDDLPGVVERLASASDSFVVGGLSSSRGRMVQLAHEAAEGVVNGVRLAPEISVVTGLTQGCSPIGSMHTITAGERNVIFELDGRKALDVFKEDIGEILARRMERVAGYIHVSFPVPGSDTGDYLVRNLIGIDPARGWIAIGAMIESGRTIRFVRRDRAAAEEDLIRMLAGLKRRLAGRPRAGLYFSCLARGPNLFGPNSEEIAILRRELGEFPLTGMFCNGEISNARLYGYTGVLTLFA